jgi:phosphoglycerol transferase MdoB-like AlkP superfamily enzyme
MAGLFNIKDGANAIKFLCKPFEYVLRPQSIGRLLQFFHLFGYLSLLVLLFFYPSTRLTAFIILSSVLFLFFIFNGCILTSAEIDYLGKKETIPGLVLEAFHLRPGDKKTDYFIQKAGSIIAVAAPIIFILAIGVKSKHTVNE